MEIDIAGLGTGVFVKASTEFWHSESTRMVGVQVDYIMIRQVFSGSVNYRHSQLGTVIYSRAAWTLNRVLDIAAPPSF